MRGKERERLIYAVMVKEPNVVNLLVQNGCERKVKNNQGQKSDDVEYEVIMRVGLSRALKVRRLFDLPVCESR